MLKKFKMPSQTKLYNLNDGWLSKETADGARALYHRSTEVFAPKKWYEGIFWNDGMATVYSDSLVKVRAARRVAPHLLRGAVRAIIWDVAALPAGNIADVIVLGILRKDERVIGGYETHSALTSGGSAATGSVGNYAILADGISLGAVDTAAKFLAAVDWDAANTQAGVAAHTLAATQALGYGYTPTADQFLVIVNSVEAFATAGVLKGHMNVVVV